MDNISEKYRLSIYSELVEISKEKIYIVKSSLDDKIYIKKLLESKNRPIYEKIKGLSISNIPKIYEIISLEEKLVIIEEYINGSSLEEILSKEKTISKAKVVQYTLDLIDILENLHLSTPPIIHKDIKPSNIMINNDGILKLIDFDISRMHKSNKTKDTHILGSYGYASPEQFGFNQTDPRSDIYAIGVTMNMMLLGELPGDQLYRGDLSKIISKCTQLDPDKRYKNLGEVKAELVKRKKKKTREDNSYLTSKLPGFRSGNFIYKIIASLWYGILLMAAIGSFDKEPLSQDRLMDIIMSLFLFLLTLFYANYNNIRSKLPITSSKNMPIRILGYILYTIILLFLLGIIIPG